MMTVETGAPNQEQQNTEQAAASGLFNAPESEEREPNAPETPEAGEETKGQEETLEEVELSSLAELAEYVKQVDPDAAIDAEALMKLSIPTKVNGKEGSITIADAIARAQMIEASDAYLAEGKQKSKAIVEEAEQYRTQWNSQLTALSEIVKEAEAELQREEKIDWAKLEEDDPALFAAKKEKLRERRERLQKIKERAGANYKEASQRDLQKNQETLKQHIAKEREKLLKAIPDLADEEKGPELTQKIAKDLAERGFSQEEIAQAYDSRIVAMAHDAMLYREATKKKEAVARKKVIKVPRVTKPGSREGGKPNGADADTDGWGILFKNV